MFSKFGLDNFSQMSEKSGECPFLRRTTRLSHVKRPEKMTGTYAQKSGEVFLLHSPVICYTRAQTHTRQIEASAIATRITLLEQKC